MLLRIALVKEEGKEAEAEEMEEAMERRRRTNKSFCWEDKSMHQFTITTRRDNIPMKKNISYTTGSMKQRVN